MTVPLLVLAASALSRERAAPQTRPKPMARNERTKRELNVRLFAALSRRSEAEVSKLLARGADPNAVDPYGQTPLVSVLGNANQRFPMLRRLIAAGANVKANVEIAGDTVSATVLTNEIEKTDASPAIVRYLLSKGAPIQGALPGNVTPLHLAVCVGNVGVARVLIQHGAKLEARTVALPRFRIPSDVKRDSETYRRWKEELEYSREKTRLAMALAREPGYPGTGHTPLFFAFERWNPEMLSLLRKAGADIRAKDDGKWTLLHQAATTEHVSALKALVDAGLDPNAESPNGYRPLHVAAHFDPNSDREATLRYLLESGADPKATTIEGRTPADVLRDDFEFYATQLVDAAEPPDPKWTATFLDRANRALRVLSPDAAPLILPPKSGAADRPFSRR